MDEISAALIAKTLDGLALRNQFTAQNIANANTPEYRPVRVSFEDSLRAAARRGPEAIRDVRPVAQTATSEEAPSELRLDLELADAAQTSMRYRALIEILGRQLALSRSVVSQGGR